MPTAVKAAYGALSDTGLAREAVYGTALTPTTFMPMTGNGLNLDPGLFSPKLMFGHREVNSFALQGQYKNTGAIAGPLWPTNAATLIPGAIGPDAQPGYGVVGATGSGSTTLSSPSAAGATSVSVAASAGFSVGQVVQVDVNNTTGPTTAECRKITTITGSGPYAINLDSALTYAHASGVAVIGVVAPYTHAIQQAVALSSYTVEKCLGGPALYGGESLQFAGARVNKLSINATATDAEVTLSADMVAQSVGVLDTPSTVAVVTEEPFVFAEATLSLFGQTLAIATGFTLDIDNKLESTYTFNGSHNLQFLTPTTFEATGKVDMVWQSFDDVTWGYFSKMLQAANGVLTFTLAHPSSGGSVSFSCPQVYIKSLPEDPKMENIITSTLNYVSFLNLAAGNSISATIVNSAYLPL